MKTTDIELESLFIAWCELQNDPSGKNVLPFEAFKWGFTQGQLMSEDAPEYIRMETKFYKSIK